MISIKLWIVLFQVPAFHTGTREARKVRASSLVSIPLCMNLFKVLYQITCQEHNSMLNYCYHEFVQAEKSRSHQDSSLKFKC